MKQYMIGVFLLFFSLIAYAQGETIKNKQAGFQATFPKDATRFYDFPFRTSNGDELQGKYIYSIDVNEFDRDSKEDYFFHNHFLRKMVANNDTSNKMTINIIQKLIGEESDFATTIATYDVDYNFFINDLVPPFHYNNKLTGAYFFVSSYDKLRAPQDYYFVLSFFSKDHHIVVKFGYRDPLFRIPASADKYFRKSEGQNSPEYFWREDEDFIGIKELHYDMQEPDFSIPELKKLKEDFAEILESVVLLSSPWDR